jgi:hypothetical protein
MTYVCPAWEFAADNHMSKLQRLQNGVLRTISNVTKRTPTPALHLAFQIPQGYLYVTKICKKQTKVIQNHDSMNVRNTGRNETRHRKFKRLKLGGGQAYDRSNV